MSERSNSSSNCCEGVCCSDKCCDNDCCNLCCMYWGAVVSICTGCSFGNVTLEK